MKKRVYLMTVISAVAIALTACGGNSANNKSSGTESASGSAVSSKAAASVTGAAIEFNPSDYIDKLAEYKGLEYSKIDTGVTDAEVEDKVKAFLSNYPEKITNRAVKKGDTVNIDYEGKKDGVAFDGGTAKGTNLNIGSGMFIEGFEDGLIGKKPGETVDLNLTFPKDYKSEELKGAKVVFTVKINYIVGEAPKELTDEIVKANTNFKTAADYKADIKAKLETSKKEEAKDSIRRELIEKVVTNSAIKSVPKEAEDRYYAQIMEYWNNVALQYGGELKDFEAEVRAQAVNAAKQLLVVRAIAEKENLELTDEEYKAGVNKYLEDSGLQGNMDAAAFESNFGKGRISDLILTDKVGNFLIENGKEVSK